jgi:hypothetical protein
MIEGRRRFSFFHFSRVDLVVVVTFGMDTYMLQVYFLLIMP